MSNSSKGQNYVTMHFAGGITVTHPSINVNEMMLMREDYFNSYNAPIINNMFSYYGLILTYSPIFFHIVGTEARDYTITLRTEKDNVYEIDI